jgi:hypothetical protein
MSDNYCERCCTERAHVADRGDGVRWCADCIDNYDPTPWQVDSEANGPRDAAHRMQEARKLR